MIDWSPLLISLKTASLTMIFVFFLGLLAARWVVNLKSEGLKMILDGLLTLPLVLPPTVVGWLLLGEKISWMSILGAVLITLGVIFANKDGSQS